MRKSRVGYQLLSSPILLFVCTFISLISFPAFSSPIRSDIPGIGTHGDDKPAVADVDLYAEPWPAEVAIKIKTKMVKWQERIHEAIFRAIRDVDLVKTNVGKLELGVSVGRNVYQNFDDTCDTRTVIDRYRIEAELPFVQKLFKKLGKKLEFGWQTNLEETFEFEHIRIVVPTHAAEAIPGCRKYKTQFEIANDQEKRAAEIRTYFSALDKTDGQLNPQERTEEEQALLDKKIWHEIIPGLELSDEAIQTVFDTFYTDEGPDGGIMQTQDKLVELLTATERGKKEWDEFVNDECGALLNSMRGKTNFRIAIPKKYTEDSPTGAWTRYLTFCAANWMKDIHRTRQSYHPSEGNPNAFMAEVVDIIQSHVDADPLIKWLGAENIRFSNDTAGKLFTWNQDVEQKGTLEFRIYNAEREAYYNRLWDLLFVPSNLPYDVDTFHSRLDEGEIASWELIQGISTGPHMGWTPTDGIELEAFFHFVWSGRWKVSVLKESERFARVKVRKEYNEGTRKGIKLGIETITGSIIFGFLDWEKYTTIVPFSLSSSEVDFEQFDATFRYDLENPRSHAAFTRALAGDFVESDKISEADFGFAAATDEASFKKLETVRFATQGVIKLGERNAHGSDVSEKRRLEIGYLYRYKNEARCRSFVAEVKTSYEGRTTLQVRCDTSKSWRTWWNGRERRNYQFNLSYDPQKDAKKEPALSMEVQGRIYDTDTMPPELDEYIHETEAAVNQTGRIFPRLPDDIGTTNTLLGFDFLDYLPWPNLGRYSFFYNFYVDQTMLGSFMDVTEVEMWKHLEYAFLGERTGQWTNEGSRSMDAVIRTVVYPFTLLMRLLGFDKKFGLRYFQALRVKDMWVEMQQEKDAMSRAEKLGMMFYTRVFAPEMIRLIKSVIHEKGPVALPYNVSGSGRLLGGNITKRGHFESLNPYDPRLVQERDDQLFEFDNPNLSNRKRMDAKASVGGLSVQNAEGDADINGDLMYLKFALSEDFYALDEHIDPQIHTNFKPEDFRQLVFIQVVKNGLITKPVFTDLIDPKQSLRPGINTVVLDRRDFTGPYFNMLSRINEEGTYIIRMRVSRNNGLTWGPYADDEFVVSKVLDDMPRPGELRQVHKK